MKRSLYFIICFIILIAYINISSYRTFAAGDGVAINDSNFPDANFRNCVSKYDKNSDGILSQAELDDVTGINCDRMEITSLKGIEYFKNINTLRCSYNNIAYLDLTANKNLIQLDCCISDVNEIKLDGLENLTWLRIENNKLTHIDISTCFALEDIDLYNNQLESIDLTHNPNLISANLSYNNISYLDVTHNPKLKVLSCCNDPLTSIDVTGNKDLRYLDVSVSGIKTLNLGDNTLLEVLRVGYTDISDLDISANTDLRSLSISDVNIKKLDLTSCPYLEELYYNCPCVSEVDSYVYDSKKNNGIEIGNYDRMTYGVNLIISKELMVKTTKTDTVHLTYDSNGGSGHMDTEEFYVEPGSSVSYTLPECGFIAPRGKMFEKWNMGNPGDTISISSDITAVAQWKDDPSAVTEAETQTEVEIQTEAVTESSVEEETGTTDNNNTGRAIMFISLLLILIIMTIFIILILKRRKKEEI